MSWLRGAELSPGYEVLRDEVWRCDGGEIDDATSQAIKASAMRIGK